MAGKTASHEYRRRTTGTRQEKSNSPDWPPGELTAMWLGLPWVNLYFQAWARWLDELSLTTEPWRKARELNDDRRREPPPWVPQFETSVIPLRRSTDMPGSEAARVSMRMSVPSLPWAPGTGNVISIDTLLPRPTNSAEDTAENPDKDTTRRPASKA